MSNSRTRLRSTLFSALGFGIGFVLGALLTNLIFASNGLDGILNLFESGQLTFGLILVLLVAGLGGAVGGAIGGLILSYVSSSSQRWGYAWRGALSFGLSYALIVVPLTLAVSLMAFYNLDEVSPIRLMIPLGGIGLVFGAVSGLLLGLLTVGRQFWRVLLSGAISFAFGGAALGYGLAGYLLRTEVSQANWALFTGLFAFGAIGGGALGHLYDKLAHPPRPKPSVVRRFGAWYKKQSILKRVAAIIGLILLALALRAIWILSPFNAFNAPLAPQLESKTVGTHWALPVSVVENATQPVVFAADDVALAWSEANDVYYQTADILPVNVSSSPMPSSNPQLVLDSAGTAHLVWVEENEILYSRCNGADCSPPAYVLDISELDCLTNPSASNDQSTLAIDAADTLMVVWRNGEKSLLFNTWSAADIPLPTSAGCVPAEGVQPRVAGTSDTFSLVFVQPGDAEQGEIYLTGYNGSWSPPETIGAGLSPEVFIDVDQQTRIAWCNAGEGLGYWTSAGQTGEIPFPRCAGRPGVVMGANGSPRLVWYSDEVENVNGVVNPNALIYESIQTDAGWAEPAIVAQTGGFAQPALAADSNGTLYLTWADEASKKLAYTTHTEYDCSEVELSTIGQAIYEAVRQEKFRPPSDPIPYCHNRYDTLLFAPNPVAAYSDQSPTPNGTFDKFAALAKTAEYEVVFATMWYDPFNQAENPGRVLGKAIAELYQNLKADPSRYPKGLTVRILLGNPPSFAFLPGLNNQTWWLIDDLRAAGVPEMRNEELGWKLEVANFSGAWPHSHMKLMIVDGKTVQSVGYNMQHTHLPTDHPSGKGKGRVDLGLQVTGPAAQTSLWAFDNLWQASTQVHCDGIGPNASALWISSCQSQLAVDEHVPEVLKYHIPEDESSNAFAIFRTPNFKESDEAYALALASAQESIDTIHINFSLELICALNIFLNACTYVNRIDYMDAMMQAIEENDATVRVLVSDVAWVGIENNIAIKTFEDELAERGLSDNVEIRYFEQDMHIKAVLIDEELLIVGNQNFHYSAWGGEGLSEYNLATESPKAVEDFQRYFNYYWDRAKKRE